VREGQTPVMNAQRVQQRGVKVRHAHDVLHRPISELIGRPVDVPRLEAAACHPGRKRMAIVIPPILALRHWQSPELARPEHHRRLQQAALFQVLHQRRARLIRLGAQSLQTLGVLVVGVPRLARQKKLHVAHAALDQPPRQQTATAVLLRLRLVQAVQPLRRFGFTRQIQGLRNRRLHPRGRLEVRDARRQFRVLRMSSGVPSVDGVEKGQLVRARARPDAGGRFQMKDRRRTAPKRCALIHGGQKPRRPIAFPIHRQPAGIAENHVGGKILVRRPQSVQQPRAQGRQTRQEFSGVQDAKRGFVVHRARHHRPDEGDVVGDSGGVRQQFRKRHPALSAGTERVGSAQDIAGLFVEMNLQFTARERFPIPAVERRFFIEEIHLTRAAVLKEADDRLRPWPWQFRIRRPDGGCGTRRFRGTRRVAQKMGQG
jgi:hypothetical protein